MFLDPIPLYRLNHWLYKHNLRFGVGRFIDFIMCVVSGCEISSSAEIGEDCELIHRGLGVVIGVTAKIGKEVRIFHGVTIGRNGTESGMPVIEDNVYIGVGAKILGPIIVGKGSVIGANSVVIENVPPYSLVVGVPAKIIKSNINRADYRF